MQSIPFYCPNDLVHGLLAAHCADETGKEAGKSKIRSGDTVVFSIDHPLLEAFKKGEDQVDLNEYLLKWSILKVIEDEQSGYCGVLYQNVED